MENSSRTYQDLKKFRLPENFRGKNPIFVQIWWIVQSVLVSTSPQFMYGWRRFVFRAFGARIGKNVLLRPSVSMTFPWNVEIGDDTWIGDNVVLYSLGKIKIGNNVVVSQNSYICSGTHDFCKVSFDMERHPVVIEDQVWVANDVYVAPGITIAIGAVVGTRSSVFNDLPAGMICYGSPAKAKKRRVVD
jgi:putative colanic acid biosynthesis acetyltransferase WcaF